MSFSKSIMGSLKLLLTITLLFLIFRSVDISRIRHDLQAIDVGALVLILVVCWIGQLICSERWRIIAASLQLVGSYASFAKMYFAGMFFNIGLPSLIGGDIVKAFILSRKNHKPFLTGLASVLQDRAAGLISLLIYGTLAIAVYPIRWREIPLWSFYALAWASTAFLLGMILKGDLLYRHFLRPGNSTRFQKAMQRIAEFQHHWKMGHLRRGNIFRVTFYSFVNSALILWAFQQVTVATGHRVSFIQFCGLFPLVILATMLPVTLGGLGIREWVYVEALSLVGIPRDSGLVISLATSATLLLCNLAGLLFLPSIPAELRSRAGDLSKNEGQL